MFSWSGAGQRKETIEHVTGGGGLVWTTGGEGADREGGGGGAQRSGGCLRTGGRGESRFFLEGRKSHKGRPSSRDAIFLGQRTPCQKSKKRQQLSHHMTFWAIQASIRGITWFDVGQPKICGSKSKRFSLRWGTLAAHLRDTPTCSGCKIPLPESAILYCESPGRLKPFMLKPVGWSDVGP